MQIKLNNLQDLSGSELKEAFYKISSDVTTVDIGNSEERRNDLIEFSSIELGEVLAAIPQNVKTLIFSGQDLNWMPYKEFIHMISKLPKSLLSIDLSGNNSSEKTAIELVEIIRALPRNLISLTLIGSILVDYALDA